MGETITCSLVLLNLLPLPARKVLLQREVDYRKKEANKFACAMLCNILFCDPVLTYEAVTDQLCDGVIVVPQLAEFLLQSVDSLTKR